MRQQPGRSPNRCSDAFSRSYPSSGAAIIGKLFPSGRFHANPASFSDERIVKAIHEPGPSPAPGGDLLGAPGRADAAASLARPAGPGRGRGPPGVFGRRADGTAGIGDESP